MDTSTTTLLLCLAGFAFGIVAIVFGVRGINKGEIMAFNKYNNDSADRINNPISFWISVLTHFVSGVVAIIMSLLYLLILVL